MAARPSPADWAMSLPMRLDAELALALRLAETCGELALALRRAGDDALDIREKSPEDGLVTRADTEINGRLVDAIRRAFPGDAVIAEESAAAEEGERQRRDRCWFIDPIDGTSEFARGEPSWAIHIGLCVAGQPALGVVHEPAGGRTSWGVLDGAGPRAAGRRSGGASRDLHVALAPLDHLRLVSSKSHASPRILEVMERLAIPPERNLRIGSTGVKMAAIAWGEADLYVHPRAGTKLWDTCAPDALLRAAGGLVGDLGGAPLRYRGAGLGNDGGVLACAAAGGDAVVARLAPLVAAWRAIDAT